jgi:hypothetical protein
MRGIERGRLTAGLVLSRSWRKTPAAKMRRRTARPLIVAHLLVAVAAFKVVDAKAGSLHPMLARDFLVHCQQEFKRCEDRVVDVAISLIMTNNPEFCDPRNEDPTTLAHLVTAWMSSRPEQPGETATQGIADALFHVRPCIDEVRKQHQAQPPVNRP